MVARDAPRRPCPRYRTRITKVTPYLHTLLVHAVITCTPPI